MDIIFKGVAEVPDFEKKLTDFLSMKIQTELMRSKYFYESLALLGDIPTYKKTGEYPPCLDGYMNKYDDTVNKLMPEILKLYGFDC